ncbi:hypothetical protein K466DRAFT_212928 [Polyporus arcularius HHB13444]|uniref:Uncharacterized protein n=1 Tax=Polyporus arcularius HHB13444 TaxID=1314778 RepID=A0A5C3PFX9_9APHY|nr:hypothetical protein K466DRAFT_212928 [Polyporus arcularius HHB13444]
MERLTSLVGLTIRGVTLTSRVPAGELYRPAKHGTLALLIIWMVTTVDSAFYPVFHLLSLFTRIDHLSVNNLECAWISELATVSSSGLAPPIEDAPEVDALSVVSADPEGRWSGHRGMVHLFRHIHPRWKLKRLEMVISGVSLQDVLSDFLPDCDATLTCLCIHAAVYVLANMIAQAEGRTPGLWPVPSLRGCCCLQTLELSIHVARGTALTERSGQALMRKCFERTLILSSEILLATPPTLRKVEITFKAEDDYDDESLRLAELPEWSRLDDALCVLGEEVEVVCVMARGIEAVYNGHAHLAFGAQCHEMDKETEERVIPCGTVEHTGHAHVLTLNPVYGPYVVVL